MPNTKSAKKRMRQDAVKHKSNQGQKSRMKTEDKKLGQLIAAGDAEKAKAQMNVVFQAYDKAAKNRVIHKNQAARKKGQAARKVHGLVSK